MLSIWPKANRRYGGDAVRFRFEININTNTIPIMKYMLLIYSDEKSWAQIPPQQLPAIMEKWMGYGQDMQEAGVLVAGDQLQPTAASTTLRFQDGKVVPTDGPFAETKEQLGGYYLLDVPDVDAAIKWASQCPALFGGGSVELRPLVTRSACG